MNPIRTQEEANQIEKYLIETSMKVLGISALAAKLRVRALLASGILHQFGHPDQQPFQVAVDAAMRIPQLGNENAELN